MSRAPLRFLLTILTLWVGVRAAILLPDLAKDAAPIPPAAAQTVTAEADAPRPVFAPPAVAPASPRTPAIATRSATNPIRLAAPPRSPIAPPGPPTRLAIAVPPGAPPGRPRAASPPPLLALPQPPMPAATASRWSASAWLLVRDEGGTSLAPGGTLGGSQTGTRVTYALGGGFALSGRAYLPLRRPSGAEVAAGLDWRPIPTLPLNLLAERRQRLGREGRNAFALTFYGGASRNLTPRIGLDFYGQAGMVGLRSRDAFADGALRIARRAGPVELGAGAWGAAQPGAARLDAGPSVSWRLPIRDTNLRLQADWRFRLTGGAAPRSGPALTLAADF